LLRHNVRVVVGGKTALDGGERRLRSRALDLLLGGKVGVLVLVPGDGTRSVEVVQDAGEGDANRDRLGRDGT
jgi:hypothetical protein